MQSPNTQSRKRKFLAILPLIALPFFSLLFYAMGGGQGEKSESPVSSGLNSKLPSPMEGQSSLDKLSLYNKAAKDSASAREEEAAGPFSIFSVPSSAEPQNNPLRSGQVSNPFSVQESTGSQFGYTPQIKAGNNQQQLDDLAQKLANIQQVIETPPQSETLPVPTPLPVDRSPELERLESIMTAMKDTPAEDLEMAKMGGMLDKILDIQHPQRVSERLKNISRSNQGRVYPVTAIPHPAAADYFGGYPQKTDTTGPYKPAGDIKNIFYDDVSELTASIDQHAAVKAVIHEQQLLVSGATVKIRLEQPIYIDGQLIEKGSFVFGVCSLSGERLIVEISSIRSGNALYPVRLNVFDLDGNPGIRVPGSITRDASKQTTDQAIQSMALSTMDPSIGAQAAAAGIETAKSLLSKKVRLIRVTVKSDYPILLHSVQSF